MPKGSRNFDFRPPPEIVTLYARRWDIEPLLHNLKRWWGVANLWHQSRRMVELWTQRRCIAWSFVQLLANARSR